MNDGSRNMIGIGVATATAGIIVGAITLTGLGLRMTEFVEFVSQGNVMAMLLFIAFVCLVLGLGVPTTANYVLVATLMAPVVVELGAQSGLIIPLIAVHLFVFYYGIMGDITPPVGLATFAAAAISGEDAIKTGIQGSIYALRTVILPFIWIFNPQLLLIDIHSTGELIRVVRGLQLATLVFAAVTMNWFRVKSRLWETLLLALAVVLLFRPDFFMDRITPPTRDAPAAEVFELAKNAPSNATLAMIIKGTTLEGDDITKTVALQLGEAGADGRKRLADAGLQLVPLGRHRAGGRGQVRLARQARRLRTRLGRGCRQGAHRRAQPALVLPAGAAAGGLGVVEPGAQNGVGAAGRAPEHKEAIACRRSNPSPSSSLQVGKTQPPRRSTTSSFSRVTTQSAEALLDDAGVGSGSSVLDVATGAGYVAAAAARRGALPVGPRLLGDPGAAWPVNGTPASASSKGLPKRCPSSRRPSTRSSTPSACATHPIRTVALREALRVLKPGGKVAFAVWDAPSRALGFGVLYAAIQAHGVADVGLPPGSELLSLQRPGAMLQGAAGRGLRSAELPAGAPGCCICHRTRPAARHGAARHRARGRHLEGADPASAGQPFGRPFVRA